jgi:hypothetical protein
MTQASKNFLIYSPLYDENAGGHIVLHKLCHILNSIGHTAYLYPSMPSFELHPYNLNNVSQFVGAIYEQMLVARFNFKTNAEFNTPIASPSLNFSAPDDFIVVYPETVFGNPLNAKHIVRWLLHIPGFNNKKIYYSSNELHFLFHEAYRKFQIPNCTLSDLILTIWHLPINKYLSFENTQGNRSGSAYSLRKGKGRELVHDLRDSVLIDGKSHEEIAEIFHKVKVFYSYDLHSQYSKFAALAGCDSVVVPDPLISKEQWHPDSVERLGIAYGSWEIDSARESRKQLIEHCLNQENDSIANVKLFIEEIDKYFG